ncbi:hypothetical protein ACOMHN_006412 [Nucella lapillus]
MSAFAAMILSEYHFPVMMMVIAPNGTVVHKVNANTFLDTRALGAEDSGYALHHERYENFLREGLAKVEGL